jgi:hypothetical protein
MIYIQQVGNTENVVHYYVLVGMREPEVEVMML